MHELLLAARAGNLEQVKACLDRRDNIEIQEDDSGTPPFCAVAEGHVELVKFLIARGANVSATNCYGWNVLHVAAQKNCLTILPLLLQHTTEIDIVRPIYEEAVLLGYPKWCKSEYIEDPWSDVDDEVNGDTPFHLAVINDHLDIFKLLLDKYPQGINLLGINESSLLYYAYKYGNLEFIDYLLSKGASLNFSEYYESPPLHIAAKKNYLNCLDKLLVNSSLTDFQATDRYGDTPFHAAAWGGNLEALKKLLHKFPEGYLLDGAFGNKVWFTALDQKHFSMLNYLIEKYEDKILFQPSKSYGLPIQMAVWWYAFEHSANNQAAWQNLIQAMLKKNPALTVFIGLLHPVPVGLEQRLDIQNKLINNGAEFAKSLLEIIDNNLKSAAFKANAPLLHVACASSFNALHYLVSYIKNVNCQDKNGNTPLHYAAHNINIFHYIRLLTHADITISNNQGLTPLDIIKTQVEYYAAQAKQYDYAFMAANTACQLLRKVRLWQLLTQVKDTFHFFDFPIDVQRIILQAGEDKSVQVSLLSDGQICNLIEYGKQRATLDLKFSKTASDKTQFLQYVGTNTRYGFFAKGEFISLKDKSTPQPDNNDVYLTHAM